MAPPQSLKAMFEQGLLIHPFESHCFHGHTINGDILVFIVVLVLTLYCVFSLAKTLKKFDKQNMRELHNGIVTVMWLTKYYLVAIKPK